MYNIKSGHTKSNVSKVNKIYTNNTHSSWNKFRMLILFSDQNHLVRISLAWTRPATITKNELHTICRCVNSV